MVKDHRPHAYLIYSENDPSCTNCDEVVRRFLLTIGNSDSYVARLVEKGSVDESTVKEKYNIQYPYYPILVADLPTGVEVTTGSHKIMLHMMDMV